MNSIKRELHKYATKERREMNELFFKTKKGEYGEHDNFLGISNPDIRKVAKKYKDCDLKILEKIIVSKYNEDRLFVLIVLVEQFCTKNISDDYKKDIYNFYVKQLRYVNNWNLVDISAPHILGEYLLRNEKQRKFWDKLVSASNQWERRVCIVSTWAFIKQDNFDYTLLYAKKLLDDEEDLIHKAVGWMLREIYKRDTKICEEFLKLNYVQLPRTTLRYAIERMPEKKRKIFLQGKF